MTISETSGTDTSEARPLSTWEVLLLSGIGGAVFTVGSYPELLKGDIEFFVQADSAIWLGVVIRMLGGCFLGAFWGYLNQPETKPIRAFQIGLIAPAAIAGMVYANIGNSSEGENNAARAPATIENGGLQRGTMPGLFSFVSTAHADGLSDTIVIQPSSPVGTFIDRVVRGIVGK